MSSIYLLIHLFHSFFLPSFSLLYVENIDDYPYFGLFLFKQFLAKILLTYLSFSFFSFFIPSLYVGVIVKLDHFSFGSRNQFLAIILPYFKNGSLANVIIIIIIIIIMTIIIIIIITIKRHFHFLMNVYWQEIKTFPCMSFETTWVLLPKYIGLSLSLSRSFFLFFSFSLSLSLPLSIFLSLYIYIYKLMIIIILF